uniref:Chromo domain-containing protein n=1 Tax=Trypanosoma congolense (strain IL3000) TaxID=1068625 RepID=G0UQA2_TRYCI|nr:conserved hypothetical protein [Trypanosoma congolense IL3000]
MTTKYQKMYDIVARRLNPDEGTLEYCVQWDGDEGYNRAWESRSKLVPHALEAVVNTDKREGATSLRRIAAWAGKRQRSEEKACGTSSPQFGIVVHDNAGASASGHASDGKGEGGSEMFLVGLGECVLSESSSRQLNPPKKRKDQNHSNADAMYESALSLDRQWSEQHAVSFMHSCVSGVRYTPAETAFELGSVRDGCRDASSVEIYGIVPVVPAMDTKGESGASPGQSGSEGNMQRRGRAGGRSSEQKRNQPASRDGGSQLAVQYFIGNNRRAKSVAWQSEGNVVPSTEQLNVMPLSVFRQHYPQLLLDFLLKHSVVLESL